MAFCKEFNAKTQDKGGMTIPVVITVYADRSFSFILKSPPAAVLIKKYANLPKGSGKPNTEKVGKITRAQIAEIVKIKAEDLNAADPEAAGADAAGLDDLLERVKGGWTDFDVAIATPDAMKQVRTVARVLGPRGLMPNPKTGTVTDDVVSAIKAAQAGKVDFRMDRTGNLCVPAGKLSFEASKLVDNIRAIIDAVEHERPAAAKGLFIRSCTISPTMGVGVRVIVKE